MNTELAASAFLNASQHNASCALCCTPDGRVTGMVGDNLLGLRFDDDTLSSNVFEECPVFIGIESDVAALVDVGGQINLPSVVLDPSSPDDAVDIRVVPHSDCEFLIVATRSDVHSTLHVERLRKARAEGYASDLAALERTRYEQVYEYNPVIAFAVTEDGKLLGASKEARAFAIGSTETSFEDWAWDFIAVVFAPMSPKQPRKVRDCSNIVTSAIRHDGAICIVELSVHSLHNPLTGLQEHYFALRDITMQEATLRALRRQNRISEDLAAKLGQSNERLSKFAGFAAHDIVAPIGRMAVFSELLEMKLDGKLDDEDARFYLTAIANSARASTAVVRDILELAQVDSLEAEIESCDLERTILDIAANIGDIDLALHLQFEGAMSTINADPRLLGFILRNVLGNAWKYRSDERRLAITVTTEIVDGKTKSFSIEDNGRGFNTSVERSAFDPFVRMSSASGTKGTGLGLSMVRSAADTLGWTVEISSEEGVGTRFGVSGL